MLKRFVLWWIRAIYTTPPTLRVLFLIPLVQLALGIYTGRVTGIVGGAVTYAILFFASTFWADHNSPRGKLVEADRERRKRPHQRYINTSRELRSTYMQYAIVRKDRMFLSEYQIMMFWPPSGPRRLRDYMIWKSRAITTQQQPGTAPDNRRMEELLHEAARLEAKAALGAKAALAPLSPVPLGYDY